MGEIRSTIDLIMERTRGMTLSDREKEDFHREELRKKAKGLRIRLTEDRSPAPEVFAEIEAEPEQDREVLRSFLWQEMIEALPNDKTAAEYIDLMEQFPQGKANIQLLNQLRSFVKTSAKMVAANKKKALVHERKRLEAMGISGTAVVPRLPQDADVNADPDASLERYKRELLAASNS